MGLLGSITSILMIDWKQYILFKIHFSTTSHNIGHYLLPGEISGDRVFFTQDGKQLLHRIVEMGIPNKLKSLMFLIFVSNQNGSLSATRKTRVFQQAITCLTCVFPL